MIYVLLITSIVLSIMFYVYSHSMLSQSVEKNIVNTIAFLLLSMGIAYLVNKFWNIKDASVPMPEAPKSSSDNNTSDSEGMLDSLKMQFAEFDKLSKFSISSN